MKACVVWVLIAGWYFAIARAEVVVEFDGKEWSGEIKAVRIPDDLRSALESAQS